MNFVVGVDTGLKGGVVVLDEGGRVEMKFPLPTIELKKGKKKKK